MITRLVALHPACGQELVAGEPHSCPATGQSFTCDLVDLRNAALSVYHAGRWAIGKLNKELEAAELDRTMSALRTRGAHRQGGNARC